MSTQPLGNLRLLSPRLLYALVALLMAPQVAANTFMLDLEGPAEIAGSVGTPLTVEFTVTLEHQGESPGARAWQFIVEAEGATILDIGIEGTDAAAAIDTDCTTEYPLCYRLREQTSTRYRGNKPR